jgi:hypothetical protein
MARMLHAPIRAQPAGTVGDIEDSIGQTGRALPQIVEREFNDGIQIGIDFCVVSGIDLCLDHGSEEAQVEAREQITVAFGQAALPGVVDTRTSEVVLEHGRIDLRDKELPPGLDMNDGAIEARLFYNTDSAKLHVGLPLSARNAPY